MEVVERGGEEGGDRRREKGICVGGARGMMVATREAGGYPWFLVVVIALV